MTHHFNSEQEEHEAALLHGWRLIAELQEQVRSELDSRRHLEAAGHQQSTTIAQLAEGLRLREEAVTTLQEDLRLSRQLMSTLESEREAERKAAAARATDDAVQIATLEAERAAAAARATDDAVQIATLEAERAAAATRATEDAMQIDTLEERLQRARKSDEELIRKSELIAELSERLGRECELRSQVESDRDRLALVRASGSAAIQQPLKELKSRLRRTARSLSTFRGTADKLGLRLGAGRHAIALFARFVARPMRLREANQIAASGLFDEAHYRRLYPDVTRSRMSPLAHYVLIGADEGRNPHILFETNYYLRRNPDVASSGINPLAHYAVHGAFEGRNPHPLFDTAYYLRSNPDVRRARVAPLGHFLKSGGFEGRNPNPFFDSAYYLRNNLDVAESGMNPLLHFHVDGWREGRRPSEAFDTAFYLSQNPDVGALHGNPLEHYLECGQREGRDATDPVENPEASQKAVRHGITMRVSTLEGGRDQRPTILCLSHVMPFPPRAGNEYRIYRMLRWFRDQGYRIVPVIAPLPGERVSSEAVRNLADEFSNAVLCERDGRLEYVLRSVPDNLSSLAGQPARPVAALLSEDSIRDVRERKLLQIDRTFCNDAVVTTVLRLQSVLGRHVFIAEYIWMSRILPLVSGDVLKIVDTIDVFSSKQKKVIQFGINDTDIDPDQESRRLRDADLVLAIQDDERRELQEMLPGQRVLTVGVDFDVVDGGGVPIGRSILYVASDNPLNKKGLKDFLRFAWPQIRREVPDAELMLAGRVSFEAGDGPGVVRLGLVPDLDALYARARLVINPAVAGTGIKIKTLEALSHLRPIVTWPNGAEGLEPELARLCVIVRDWYEFGQKVTEALALEVPRLFSTTESDAVVRLTSPAFAYRSVSDAIAEFLSPNEPQR